MSDVTRSLASVFAKITKATQDTISKEIMKELGQFAVDTIVKRTRLGYGVDIQYGAKSPLKALSNQYKVYRKDYKDLSSTTKPGKSNLTLTGQMLASVQVIYTEAGLVRFGPTGTRTDSNFTIAQIASFQEKQGRPFNRVSQLEYQQVLRYYRRQFGDLLKKRQLIT